MDDRTHGIVEALRMRISHDPDAFAELDDLVRVMRATKATGIREAAETIAALLARAEAAEARLAHAERELLVIQDSMEQSRDPYDRGAYAICEDILAILRGRADDIEPEQGGEE